MRRPERRFWFRLALALGKTVKEAQEGMTSREFAEWAAYYDLEPFGERRADLRAGRICATFANVMGGGKATPADFMPSFEPAQPESPAVMRAKLHMAIGKKGKPRG